MTDYPGGVEPGGAGTSPSVAAQQEASRGSGMRSPRGLLGSLVLLLALPIAVLTQVLFGSGSADSDPRRARCGLRSRFVLRLRFRNAEVASVDRMRLRWRLCGHLLGASCEHADRKRVVLLLHQRSARILAGEDIAQPHHVLARWDVADRQPGQDEDPGLRCHGDSRVRGSVRVFRSSCPWHQPVSGDGRREAAVSPAVRLASLREREEAPRTGP